MSLEEAIARRNARIENLRVLCAPIFASCGGKITLEIGCGKGHYLSAYAAAFPGETCVGIDLISERVRDGARRAANRRAENAHFVKAEASEFLESMPPEAKLGRVFVFFPDPWPKAKHHRRRLMQPAFLDALRPFCLPGAKLHFRTDYAEYFASTREIIALNPNWRLCADSSLPLEEVSQFQRILPEFSTLAAEAV